MRCHRFRRRFSAICLSLVIHAVVIGGQLRAEESRWLKRSGFDELRQGSAEDGGQNTYVSHRGRVQTINRLDLNVDGEIDLLFTQDHDTAYAPDSLIYWGGPDGFHSLLPEMSHLRSGFSLLTWMDQARERITRLPSMGGGRAEIADLNGDGYPEIVLANFMHNYRTDQSALIYWGGKTGYSVDNRTELPAWLASGVAVGDLNGDGLPEIVLSNRGDERGESWGYRLHRESFIYWGSATGYSLTGRTSISTISAADVAMGDFNGDQAADLAFVNFNRQEQSVFVYFNDAQGGFSEERRQVISRDELRLAESGNDLPGRNRGMQTLRAAKLNEDGFDDLIVAGTDKAVVFLGSPDGLNVDQALELPANNCQGAAAADLNGDGRPEILLANRGYPGDGLLAEVETQSSVFWASGDNYDANRRTELPTLGAATVTVADLNQDNHPDILFGNSWSRRSTDVPSHIYWGGANGYAAHRRKELTGFGVIGSGVADLNRDGWPDILLVSRSSGTDKPLPASIYWGSVDHHYSSAAATQLDVNPNMEYSVADLDDDGFPDLVFNSGVGSGRAFVMWGSKSGFQASNRTDLPIRDPIASSVADLNRDGFLDLLFSITGNSALQRRVRAVIVWGNANRFSEAATTEWELSTSSAIQVNTIADLNRDGYLDLVFPQGLSTFSEIWYGSSTGYSPEKSKQIRANAAPHAAVADLDADGWLDLVLTSGDDIERFSVHTPTFIYWGGPNGFSEKSRCELESYTGLDVAIADWNRDSHLDLAISNYRSDTSRKIPTFIYWGDGSRDYNQQRRSLLKSASGSAIDAPDLNRDGWPELVVSNHQENFDHAAAGTDIFWGGEHGLSHSRRTVLPTVGVHLDSMVEGGNVYDRRYRWAYRFDPVTAPDGPRFARLHWNATSTYGASVNFQVRSASSRAELETSPWHGPQGPDSFYLESPADLASVPQQNRWLQYRAVFNSPDGANSAYLEEVAVECVP